MTLAFCEILYTNHWTKNIETLSSMFKDKLHPTNILITLEPSIFWSHEIPDVQWRLYYEYTYCMKFRSITYFLLQASNCYFLSFQYKLGKKCFWVFYSVLRMTVTERFADIIQGFLIHEYHPICMICLFLKYILHNNLYLSMVYVLSFFRAVLYEAM
jgi:hypothetical protein